MKLKGIKKAVGDFNRWNGTAEVWYNKELDTIWTNTHTGQGYFEYPGQEDEVIRIVSKGHTMASGSDQTSMAKLRAMVPERIREEELEALEIERMEADGARTIEQEEEKMELNGMAWGDLTDLQQENLMESARTTDWESGGAHKVSGECIVDFANGLSITGYLKVTDDDYAIIILDSAVIYDPSL